MLDIDDLIPLWLRWRDRLETLEINRATGKKSFGLEYRLMLEAGTITIEKKLVREQLVFDIDTVWRRCYQWYPQEMDALRIYYLRKKSYRQVRMHLNCSQHMSKVLVAKGADMMRGGLAVLTGFQDLMDK